MVSNHNKIRYVHIYFCSYKDDRCCYYCDKKWDCKAKAKCEFDCWDDDKDNKDDVNAYWEDDKE